LSFYSLLLPEVGSLLYVLTPRRSLLLYPACTYSTVQFVIKKIKNAMQKISNDSVDFSSDMESSYYYHLIILTSFSTFCLPLRLLRFEFLS